MGRDFMGERLFEELAPLYGHVVGVCVDEPLHGGGEIGDDVRVTGSRG
jgi:hypothetical protein